MSEQSAAWAAAWKRAARFERQYAHDEARRAMASQESAGAAWHERNAYKLVLFDFAAGICALQAECDRLKAALDAISYGDIVPAGEYRAWARAVAGRALGVVDVPEVGDAG